MNAMTPWSARANVKTGTPILFGGKLFFYQGRARDSERRHVFRSDEGISRDFSDDEIFRLPETLGPDGMPLLHWVSSAELETLQSGKQADWTSLYEQADGLEKQRVDRLHTYIRAWEMAGRPPKTAEGLKPVIEKAADMLNLPRVSPSSLRRALARWDGELDSLVSQHHLKGNCLPKSDDEAWTKHHEFACKNYFVAQRPDLQTVHELVKLDFVAWNKTLLPGSRQLKELSRSTTYEMIKAEGGFIRDYTRIGSRMAMREHRAIGKAPDTLCVNDVWEVDASPVPVMVLDDESLIPIGRPTVTLVQDRTSRGIMGFALKWNAEGLRSVAEAIGMSMTTKEALLSSVGIVGKWGMFGKPGMIVADNATHTRAQTSKGFRLICERIGCEPSNTPVKRPWEKGKIERLLRTYFFKVCHVVPGSTFSNIFERSKEVAPETTAVCTLSDMRLWLIRFIVEVYNPTHHRGLNDSPNRVYEASAAQFGITPAPDRARLTAMLSLPIWRSIQSTGLNLLGLHYHSDKLMEYKQMHQREGQVTLIVDSDDVTRAWWIDPRNGKQEPLFLNKPDRDRYRGWTLEKYERVRAMQRNNPELLAGDEGARKAHALYVQQMLALKGSGGLANRKRAARAMEKLRKRAKAMFNDDFEEEPVEEGGLLDGLLDDGLSQASGSESLLSEGERFRLNEMAVVAESPANAVVKTSARKHSRLDDKTQRTPDEQSDSGSTSVNKRKKPQADSSTSAGPSTAEAVSEEAVDDPIDSESLRAFAKRLVAKARKLGDEQ